MTRFYVWRFSLLILISIEYFKWGILKFEFKDQFRIMKIEITLEFQFHIYHQDFLVSDTFVYFSSVLVI